MDLIKLKRVEHFVFKNIHSIECDVLFWIGALVLLKILETVHIITCKCFREEVILRIILT